MKSSQFFQVGQRRRHLPSCPGILISLWDIMNELLPLDIYDYARTINIWHNMLSGKPIGCVLSEEEKKNLSHFASQSRIDELSRLGWSDARTRLVSLMCLAETSEPVSAEIALQFLMELDQAILGVLCTWKCVQISPKKTTYFNQRHLLGKMVSKSFPSATEDIKSAGNCIALELNTSAVFHLMLIAEKGMRSLAKRLKVKLKHDLEYEDWGAVIAGIQAELGKISPRSKKGEAKVVFYREIKEDVQYLKDVWRNKIFHGREKCDVFDAEKSFAKVKDLMERLATNGFRENPRN
jgi:hypothetical protein